MNNDPLRATAGGFVSPNFQKQSPSTQNIPTCATRLKDLAFPAATRQEAA
jgi:hypothetical protein